MTKPADLGQHYSSRRRILSPAWLWLLCWLSLAAVPIAAAPLDTHQLLRYHSVVDDQGAIWDDELVFFRDGQVSVRREHRGTVRYELLRASPAIVARLRQVLATERVGLLRANGCQVSDELPHTASFRGTITWFGKGKRMVRLDVNDQGPDPDPDAYELCSESVQRLFDELYDLFGDLYHESSTPPPAAG